MTRSRHLTKITVFTAVAENHCFRDLRDFWNMYCLWYVSPERILECLLSRVRDTVSTILSEGLHLLIYLYDWISDTVRQLFTPCQCYVTAAGMCSLVLIYRVLENCQSENYYVKPREELLLWRPCSEQKKGTHMFNINGRGTCSCTSVREAGTICPRPCKLTCDLLTLKVVPESRVTWATSVPILVFIGLSVLDLGPMYATDRRQTRIIF